MFASGMKAKQLYQPKHIIKIPKTLEDSPFKLCWPGTEGKKPAKINIRKHNIRAGTIKS